MEWQEVAIIGASSALTVLLWQEFKAIMKWRKDRKK